MRYLSEKDNLMKDLYKLAVAFEKASQGIPSLEQIRNISEKGPFGGALKAPGKSAGQDPQVLSLQLCLMNLGFPLPKHGADGIMGEETQQAINAFKASRKIPNASPDIVFARIHAEGDKLLGGRADEPTNQLAFNVNSPAPARAVPKGTADPKELKNIIDPAMTVNPNSGNFTPYHK